MIKNSYCNIGDPLKVELVGFYIYLLQSSNNIDFYGLKPYVLRYNTRVLSS